MYVQLKCQDPNYCGLERCINYAVISKTHFSIVRVSRSPQLYGQDKVSEDVTLKERKEKHDGTTLKRPIKQQVPYVMVTHSIFFMMFASKKSTQHCTGNRTDAVWNRIVCSAAYLKQRRSIVITGN